MSIGVVFGPELPRLKSLPQHVEQQDQSVPTNAPRSPEPISTWRPKGAFERQSPLLRLAYVNPDDPGGMASLQLHAEKLDAVILDCLELTRAPDGVRLDSVKECRVALQLARRIGAARQNLSYALGHWDGRRTTCCNFSGAAEAHGSG